MKYYSTNNKSFKVDLKKAVIDGLAPDNGLFMPEKIPSLGEDFFRTLPGKTLPEIAYEVSSALIGDDIPADQLKRIVEHTVSFEAPVVQVDEQIYSLELFHGPTLAFKDFGARFMSQLLGFFAGQQDKIITILVATSGDTGSAVANGFLDVPGVNVVVLYPSGKVSDVQEKQFTTLGKNITALEVDGTFDDCQRLVKQAFGDAELKTEMFLTSANSINIARLIPQSFYYFGAYAQLAERKSPLVFSVPSGNFGNLTGGILAMKMGLPVKQFIASTNVNDIVPHFLATGAFAPKPSVSTISNAMDVGNPSNFSRLMDLFNHDRVAMAKCIKGFAFTDDQTAAAMREVYSRNGYLLDPHGAVGYLGLKEYFRSGEVATGVFLETAHPGKFLEVVNKTVDQSISLPDGLKRFMKGKKVVTKLASDYSAFRDYLRSR